MPKITATADPSGGPKPANATVVTINAEARTELPAPSNGEVEGPDDHAGQAPRAHTVPTRPRRQTDHASRTPPTIVRRHGKPPTEWPESPHRVSVSTESGGRTGQD